MKFLGFAIGTVAVIAVCAIWIGYVVMEGNKTYAWTPVKATVVETGQLGHGGRGFRRVYAVVQYDVDQNDYRATLFDELMTERATTIFVNPDDPTDIVPDQGPLFKNLGRPVIVGVAGSLFGVVLVLIKLSPKEDD